MQWALGSRVGTKNHLIPQTVIKYLHSEKLTQSLTMAFTFLRSYQPDTENPDDEEEDEMPMARSGSVRAFSHLPDRAGAEVSADAPPPQVVVGRNNGTRPYNPMPVHEEEDDDGGEMPMARSGSVRAISHLPDRAENSPSQVVVRGSGGMRPYSPMDEVADESTSPTSRDAEEETPGDDDAPSLHAPPNRAPDTGEAAPTLPRTSGLMMRPRPMPLEYARRQARGRMANSPPYGDERAATEADAPPETQDLDTPTDQHGFPQDNRPPETTLNTPVTTVSRRLQQQAPGARILQAARDAEQQQQGMQRFQAAAPAQQKQVGGSTTPPAPQAPKQAQPPAPQNAADAGQSAEKTPAPQQQIKVDASNPHFGIAARAALLDEADNSPTAAALQKEAARLGISIVSQRIGMSVTKLENGKPVIYFNPNPSMNTNTTMSHEIAHAIQMAAAEQVLEEVRKTGKIPDGKDIDRAIKAGRDALNKIVPVKSDKDQGQDYKENEAMRVAHIVGAERTASEMKNLPEGQKTLEEFLRRQNEKEKARGEPEKGRKHPNNNNPIPPGTERGKYDYQYVRDVLGLDEKGQKKFRPLSPVRPLPSPQNSPPQQPLLPPQPLG
jgi:hypothetical protein